MEVGAEAVCPPAPLCLVLAIISLAPEDPPDGNRFRVQVGSSAVVFKADNDSPEILTGVDLDYADEAALATLGHDREDAESVEQSPVGGPVAHTEKLKSATYCEHYETVGHRLVKGALLKVGQFACHGLLVAISATAEEENVEFARINSDSGVDPLYCHGDLPPFASPSQSEDISLVSVEAHGARE